MEKRDKRDLVSTLEYKCVKKHETLKFKCKTLRTGEEEIEERKRMR